MKADLLPIYRRLIEYSDMLQFALPLKFILLHARFLELIPDLRLYFQVILDRPEWHHGKVMDAIEVLKQVNADFVAQELASRGKTMDDFSS